MIECGIGGEYDSTNIITKPVVTGITNLAIDHSGMLGSTIGEIAWHKAGIMKEGTKCFTVSQREAAANVLKERAQEKGVTLEVVPLHPDLESNTVPLGLSASFQKSNASLAIAICQHFLTQRGFPAIRTTPLNESFKQGLKDVRWGGRCETRHENSITWCIDGGHTLESIELVGKWFAEQVRNQQNTITPADQTSERKRVLIFNQQTRDANALARALHATLAAALGEEKPFTHAIFCTNTTFKDTGFRPDLVSVNTNAAEIKELSVQKGLAQAWEEIDSGTEVRVVETIEEAVQIVRQVAKEGEGEGGLTVLATGSLHLVGGLLEVLESKG